MGEDDFTLRKFVAPEFVFGVGARHLAGRYAKNLGGRKILVVSDPGVIAAALGASPNGVLWRVRLPMLLRPILTALAVGLAVSVGQYLPTLLIGGGRVATLTTEAVALASGGDRRAIGVYGLMQTGAALVPFALALLIPAMVWRNKRGLRHG